MRKITSSLLVAGLLFASLTFSRPAGAVSFEDSLDDCSYPAVFDVLVLRPLSFYALFVGTAIFIPLSPIAAVTVRDDMGRVADSLVGSPYRFTFKRPLGECEGVQLAY